MKKQGTLYGVGVGPGGEELLTLKAVKVIESCDVIIAPSAKAGGVLRVLLMKQQKTL